MPLRNTQMELGVPRGRHWQYSAAVQDQCVREDVQFYTAHEQERKGLLSYLQ